MRFEELVERHRVHGPGPATTDARKCDQRSYWTGYEAGYASANEEGDERERMLRLHIE